MPDERIEIVEYGHARSYRQFGGCVEYGDRAKTRMARALDSSHDRFAMPPTTDDSHPMKVHSGVTHARKHRMRGKTTHDHQRTRHRGPVCKPEPGDIVDSMQREHQNEYACLHDE